MNRRHKGFTIVELILALSLFFVLLVLTSRFIRLANTAFNSASEQYTVQMDMRNVMQLTSDRLSKTTGAFAVTDFSPESLNKAWNYIGVEKIEINGKELTQIVEIRSTEESVGVYTHSKRILAPPSENVHYEIAFEKEFDSQANADVKVYLVTYKVDKYKAGSGTGSAQVPDFQDGKVQIEKLETSVRASNSLQFIDRGEDATSVAIAFKDETRSLKTNTSDANLMMVLDYSGSMDWKVGGKLATVGKKRYKYLQDGVNDVLKKLSPYNTVLISMVGFASLYDKDKSIEFQNAKDNNTELTNHIDKYQANGGTNTGDGIRKAYYLMNEQRSKDQNNGRKAKEYFMLMVDGESSFCLKDSSGNFYVDGVFETNSSALINDDADNPGVYDDIFGYNVSGVYRHGPGDKSNPDTLEYARIMAEKVGDIPDLSRYFFICGTSVDKIPQRVPMNTGPEDTVPNVLKKALKIDDPKYADRFISAENGEQLVKAFEGLGKEIEDYIWFVDGPQ